MKKGKKEMQEKKIWIINHHASSNNKRIMGLANVFSERGYSVTVICSSFSHSDKKYIFNEKLHIEKLAGNICFFYLKTVPHYKTNNIGRILNMFSFCKMARKYRKTIEQTSGTPNFVIASSVHPLAWEVGYGFAKIYHAKFIVEVRDFWPLSLIELSHLNRFNPIVLFFGVIEKRAYRRADSIVTTMPYGYKYICEKYHYPKEKIYWMPNGINIEEADCWLSASISLPSDLHHFLSDNWCCVYTGSIVVSECIDLLIRSFSFLGDTPIHLAIVGDGQEKEKLKQLVLHLGLQEKIRFFNAVSMSEVFQVLSLGCCCCCAAHDDYPIYKLGLSMNKITDYLYSGKPTIFACDAPSAVKDAGNITLKYGDPKEYANCIRRVWEMPKEEYRAMGERGRQEVKRIFDFELIGDCYLSMMQKNGQ